MTSALFLSTDTLVKPLRGYAALRKTPPLTDPLTQHSYLTHNKTAAIPKGTAAVNQRHRRQNGLRGTKPSTKAREAHHLFSSFNPRRPRTKGPMGFPLSTLRSTKPYQNAQSAPSFPQPVIRRRPDIAGAAVCFLSGALRRTQEALAARSAQRGLLECPRTRREGTCSLPGQLRQITRRCKPSCAYPRQHRTGYRSGSREASSSRGRSRCSRPGRSRSHRHHRPCCRSRPPGR